MAPIKRMSEGRIPPMDIQRIIPQILHPPLQRNGGGGTGIQRYQPDINREDFRFSPAYFEKSAAIWKKNYGGTRGSDRYIRNRSD